MTKINNRNGTQANKPPKAKPTSVDLKCFSIQELHERAVKCYQEHDLSGEDRWNKMLAQTGTKRDKIAALGNLILEHPESSLKYFDTLIRWCFDNNHNFAIEACISAANLYADHVFGDKSQLSSFVDSVQDHIKSHKKNSIVEETQLMGFYLES